MLQSPLPDIDRWFPCPPPPSKQKAPPVVAQRSCEQMSNGLPSSLTHCSPHSQDSAGPCLFSVSTSLLFYSTLHKALFLLLPSHSPALSAQSLVFSVDHNREKSSSPALPPLTFSLVLSSCSPLQPEPESKRDQTQVPSSSL